MKTDNHTAGIELRRRWVILGVIFICTLAFVILLQSLPPVLTLVMSELGLSHAQGGLLMSFFALPGIIISLPAGLLADRYSQKAICSISFVLMIIGASVLATGHSLFTLALGRVLSGLGAITLVVVVPQFLAQWFTGRGMGIAMGVFNTAMPLGTILSLNFLSLLGERLGWRASIWTSAFMSILALGVFVLLFTPAPRKKAQISAPSESLFRELRSVGAPIWLVGAAWMFYNAASISMYTFTPDLLKATGLSVASAGFYTSVVMWPVLVMSPVVGYMIDKIDRKKTIIGFGGIILAILVVWIPGETSWLLGLLFFIGIMQSLVPTPIFALVPDVVHPEKLGFGFGIITTCVNLGIVVGPFATGLIKDLTGSYQASYSLMSGFFFLVTVSIVILGRMQSQIAPKTAPQ